MRILVTGSRGWTREDLVRGAIQEQLMFGGSQLQLKDPDWTDAVIVHGACPTGADLHAARWASDFDVRQETFPANWEMYGERAGPFRNQQMVDAGADICLAFPLGESKGTRDCMRRAVEAHIPVKVFEDLGSSVRSFQLYEDHRVVDASSLLVENPEKMIIDDIHDRTRKLIDDLTKEGS